MALTSVKSNKMRSLLTMLGIIIGIAAVIAIETVGNSMTGSVMDSMSGMGASNISVTVTQKSSSSTSGTSQGVRAAPVHGLTAVGFRPHYPGYDG